MENNDIYKRVKRVIEETIHTLETGVEMESHIIDDLGAESMDVVCIVMALEDEFGRHVPEEDIGKFERVKDIVNYIVINSEL